MRETNIAPAQINHGMTLLSGHSENLITPFYLYSHDGNRSDGPDQLTYTITSLPASGSLMKNNTALSVSGSFTQADVDNGLIKYQPEDASTPVSDTFAFTLSDGEDGVSAISGSFTIDIDRGAGRNIIKTDGRDRFSDTMGADTIRGMRGDDIITLLDDADINGGDLIVYNFGSGLVSSAVDGGDGIVNFTLGEDILNFVIDLPAQSPLTEEQVWLDFLGPDGLPGSADDFIRVMLIAEHIDNKFYLGDVLFLFNETGAENQGTVASGILSLEIADKTYAWTDAMAAIGGATNFDYSSFTVRDILATSGSGDARTITQNYLVKLFGAEKLELTINHQHSHVALNAKDYVKASGLIATGDQGKVKIYGGAADEVLMANNAGNILYGGAGDDDMTLGDGQDFVFYGFKSTTGGFANGDGHDVIYDFNPQEDSLIVWDKATSDAVKTNTAFWDHWLGSVDTASAEGARDDVATLALIFDAGTYSKITGVKLDFNPPGGSQGTSGSLEIHFNAEHHITAFDGPVRHFTPDMKALVHADGSGWSPQTHILHDPQIVFSTLVENGHFTVDDGTNPVIVDLI